MPQITVKLFATLQKFLPVGTKGRQAQVEVAEGATVGEALETLGLAPGGVHLIMVNGEHRSWETVLEEGDAVTVFPPVAGGRGAAVRERVD